MSSEMEAVLRGYAEAARRRLGAGYAVEGRQMQKRYRYTLSAETTAARHECIKNNSILKAVYGG